MTTRILLADDHHLVRQGLRALLEAQPDFELIGEASDGIQLLNQLERAQPDVLVLDIALPGLNGLDVTREARKRFPELKVCILSMHSDEGYVTRALHNGASGYVVKSAHSADLVRGLREVAAGRRYLSPPLSDRAIEAYLDKAASGQFDVYETLSNRERQVLQLSAEGLKTNEVAERLFISPRTVETYRAGIMKKLGIRNQSELVRFAVERGIVGGDSPPERTARPPRGPEQTGRK